ncbi:hypothetical protein ACKGJI_04610 [Sulfurospirillum sp. 1307]
MKKIISALGVLTLGAISSFASAANVTVPTPDYTDFYSIVGVALGVTLIVSLARKGKSFLK